MTDRRVFPERPQPRLPGPGQPDDHDGPGVVDFSLRDRHRGDSSWFELDAELEGSEEYRRAKRELDEAWEVECRYGNCTIFVSPDSNVREDLGGWGPAGCPCSAEPDRMGED